MKRPANLELPPFLLDRWIEQKHSANPPIEYDLASSTGPVWTLRELLALSGENELEALLSTSVSYTSAAGTLALRTAMSGLRIGWIIDHDPLRLERCRNARNYFTITGNVFGERQAVLALEHSRNIYARARNVARENLVLLDQVLAEHDDV